MLLGAVFRLESQAGYSHSKAKKSADTKRTPGDENREVDCSLALKKGMRNAEIVLGSLCNVDKVIVHN